MLGFISKLIFATKYGDISLGIASYGNSLVYKELGW